MDVQIGDVNIPDRHIGVLLRFEAVDQTKLTCVFDPRLKPVAGTLGPILRAAVEAALNEIAEELKDKDIIVEAQQ